MRVTYSEIGAGCNYSAVKITVWSYTNTDGSRKNSEYRDFASVITRWLRKVRITLTTTNCNVGQKQVSIVMISAAIGNTSFKNNV